MSYQPLLGAFSWTGNPSENASANSFEGGGRAKQAFIDLNAVPKQSKE
ncbi:hypothetical protein [Chamaesiphon sp. GL140_3_metabinner_50]|nr:hypothetical protein [Chamaesiphon sp. GL140_3_metabinner_50]